MDKTYLIIAAVLCTACTGAYATKAVCGSKYNESLPVDCDKIFQIFHKCISKFLETALENANPFELCSNKDSYQKFSRMNVFYERFRTLRDPNNFNVTCAEEYMDKNQMTVISTITKTAYTLWNSANCNDCYQNLSSSTYQNFSYHYLQIKKIHQVYVNCTENHRQNICKECEDSYMNLNILFEDQNKKRELCFDLVDIMNKTRLEWSGKFKCCKDKKDSLKAFFGLFSTIMLLAVIFYTSVYFTGKRNPEAIALDARQVAANNARDITQPSTSSSSSYSSASTQPVAAKKTKSINNDEDSDPESDDESILDTPKNTQEVTNLIDIN